MVENKVVAHETLVGLRAEMTISGEDVDVEGVLGKDFFFQLSREARLGTPMSFAYWLRETYNVNSEGIDLLTLPDYPELADFQRAYDEDKTKAERAKLLPNKIVANLKQKNIPEAIHKLMTTALLAELSITDLLIDIKKTEKDGKSEERKKLKFGLAITFPTPLDLMPNIKIKRLSLLILHAPADDFKFPERQAQLGEPKLVKVAAKGFIDFSGQPDTDATITLDGQTWTFVAADPKASQTLKGAKLDETLVALARDLNRVDSPKTIRRCAYRADLRHDRLLIEFNEPGPEGNTFKLEADPGSKGTVSAATLQGGADPEAPLPKLPAPVDVAASAKASGTIKLKKALKEGDSIKLNGTSFIFKDSPSGETEVKVDPDLGKVVQDLISKIEKVAKLTDEYEFNVGDDAETLKISAKNAGSEANKFTLEASPKASFSTSGPNLTGGA